MPSKGQNFVKIDSDDEPVRKRPRRTRDRDIPSSKIEIDGEQKISAPLSGEKFKQAKAPGPKVSPSASEESASENEALDASDGGEEEEKPEAAMAVRKKIQSNLGTSGQDPYPDWRPHDPVPYAALCITFSLIELTTKRLIILSYCAQFLRQVLRLTPEDLLPTVQLMVNKLAADYAGVELGIGESLIMKAIGEATGRRSAAIKSDHNEIGDLGLVAAKSRSNQPTMFKPKPLTVRGVHEGLLAVATVTGQGAQSRKVAGIKKLLSAADAESAGPDKGIDVYVEKGGASEAKYLIRFLEGKLRLGLAEKTVLVALARAMVAHEVSATGKIPSTEQLAKGEAILKTVYRYLAPQVPSAWVRASTLTERCGSELPSYEVIIPASLKHGISNLRDHCKLHPGVPLKPMLAKPTKSITEVLNRFENKEFTCEYKYDGERAQIHFISSGPTCDTDAKLPPSSKGKGGLSAIFSRNSEDLSKKYPDVLEKLEGWIRPGTESFVLDCETVAWDVAEKKVLPFQQLMTRKRKDVKAEEVKVKVCIFAFDLLFLNGRVSVPNSCQQDHGLPSKLTIRSRRYTSRFESDGS